jgi:hypothetical protein
VILPINSTIFGLTKMKIIESTDRLLIISNEITDANIKFTKLGIVQLCVNFMLALCYIPILATSNWSVQIDLPTKTYIGMCFAVNLTTAIIFYLKNTNDEEIISGLFWSLVIYFIPIAGVVILCGPLLNTPIAYLAFDKNKNILIVEKIELLPWDCSDEYPLNEISKVSLDRVTISYGSGCFSDVDAIRITRRRDGKIIFFHLSNGKDDIYIVRAINAFLSLR